MNILVGNTGFVGSNLMRYGMFDLGVHSTDVTKAYGLKPEILVYAGVTAAKYIANESEEKDFKIIQSAFENIRAIQPQKIVLISTIDVLDNVDGVDEDYAINPNKLQPYGMNRYKLECMVREEYEDAVIIRLPGLFGENIKKNLIYDYINVIPFMLNGSLFSKILRSIPDLHKHYFLNENGYYQYKNKDTYIAARLREQFKEYGFTALNFTDSRNTYQFYPLSHLWKDINIALDSNIKLLHLATEPINVSELIQYLSGDTFVNEKDDRVIKYNYITNYANWFGKGADAKYILSKNNVLEMIKEFVEVQMKVKSK